MSLPDITSSILQLKPRRHTIAAFLLNQIDCQFSLHVRELTKNNRSLQLLSCSMCQYWQKKYYIFRGQSSNSLHRLVPAQAKGYFHCMFLPPIDHPKRILCRLQQLLHDFNPRDPSAPTPTSDLCKFTSNLSFCQYIRLTGYTFSCQKPRKPAYPGRKQRDPANRSGTVRLLREWPPMCIRVAAVVRRGSRGRNPGLGDGGVGYIRAG